MKSNRYILHKVIALTIGFIGLVLLIYMITVESEPGALPLFLILLGVIWFVISKKRKNKLNK